jgi:hypothetical protein
MIGGVLLDCNFAAWRLVGTSPGGSGESPRWPCGMFETIPIQHLIQERIFNGGRAMDSELDR